MVKVQSINRVTRESMRFRRIEIDHNKLRTYPILFLFPVLTYLIVWTIIDMPKSIESLSLDRSGNGNIIDLDRFCSSGSEVWGIMSYVWQALLLLSASVLAYQSRDVVEEMNESQKIGFLVYSHFMFLIFRIVTRALALSGSIVGSVSSAAIGILLSFDILIGTMIYFGPKFYNIMTENSKGNQFNKSGLAGAGSLDPSELFGRSSVGSKADSKSKRVQFDRSSTK